MESRPLSGVTRFEVKPRYSGDRYIVETGNIGETGNTVETGNIEETGMKGRPVCSEDRYEGAAG